MVARLCGGFLRFFPVLRVRNHQTENTPMQSSTGNQRAPSEHRGGVRHDGFCRGEPTNRGSDRDDREEHCGPTVRNDISC